MARINNDHRVGKVSSRLAAMTFQSFTGPKKIEQDSSYFTIKQRNEPRILS